MQFSVCKTLPFSCDPFQNNIHVIHGKKKKKDYACFYILKLYIHKDTQE